jgi:hypothetical protein
MVRYLLAPMEWGMTPGDLEHAARMCAKKKPHVIALTEMRETWMKVAFMKGLPSRYSMTLGGECPLVYDRRFLKLTYINWKNVVQGLEGVTPALPVVEADFTIIRTKKHFRVVHDHKVPLSLHGKRREDHRRERTQMWVQGWTEFKSAVHSTSKLPTVASGDWNNRWLSKATIMRAFPRARVVVNDPLDKILLIGRRQFRLLVRLWSVRTGSDHLGHGITFWVK